MTEKGKENERKTIQAGLSTSYKVKMRSTLFDI